MRILLVLLLSLPLLIQAEVVSYGEDPFILGISIDAFALGNIKALPMQNPSPGSNVATQGVVSPKMSFQHTEGFGGVYQTDVLTGVRDRWSLLVFRGGVSGIADTRHALLDYGSDGIPETMDADGTENNGRMDPGERLNINSIEYFSTQQFLLELGYSRPFSNRLTAHGTARIIHHDLYAESGLGIGFHGGVLYEPFQDFRLGLEVTNILTTTVFWSSGQTEIYAPEIFAGADYFIRFKRIPFVLHPLAQLQISLSRQQAGWDHETWTSSLGLEIIFQKQLFIQLGRNGFGQFQVGAMVRTTYLDLHYATGFSDLTQVAGQTHRVGVGLHLDQLNLF